jgi:uncharacterized protein (AIM24 family)
MSPNVQMTTHTQFGGGGGVFGAIKRMAGGGSLFMTEYRAMDGAGELAFATRVPGQIMPVDISPGSDFMVHRHGFLCATDGVQLSVGFQQSLGAGIFGGAGFVLQKVSGQGQAWLELSGEVVARDLAAGQTLLVHPGHVGAFQANVSFQITMVRGIRNLLFGADSLFLAALTGPGRIWLQTLPISRLAQQIFEYMPQQSGRTAEAGVLGGIVGSMMNNM